MKLHVLLIAGLALGIAGCSKKEQTVVEAVDEAPAPVAEAAPVENPAWQNDAFMEHMHAHAEKLDDLNFALADGDFDAAMTPAYWLSRHDEVGGVPSDLRSYVTGIRTAASSVEEANDLETARNEAERITEECQGCHAATGIDIE